MDINMSFIDNFPQDNCVFKDEEKGILLYKADCLEFMDILIKKYP